MEVLAVTIFLSLLLAGFFVVLFLGSQTGRHTSIDQQALMPLDDSPDHQEKPLPSLSPQNHDRNK